MRRRIPEWLLQVGGGLNDGKTWLVGSYRTLPAPVRAGTWLAFQAILFKLQPELWRGFVAVAGAVGTLMQLDVRTQLLLVVLLLLSGHAAFVVPKLNSLHEIVENMDSNTGRASETVTDGGSPAERRSDGELSPSGAGGSQERSLGVRWASCGARPR